MTLVGDAVMEGENADERSATDLNPSGRRTAEGGSRQRERTTGGKEMSKPTVTRPARPQGRMSGKTTPQGPCGRCVTTQEVLDGSREKTMRVATIENNSLNWVSFSSAVKRLT